MRSVNRLLAHHLYRFLFLIGRIHGTSEAVDRVAVPVGCVLPLAAVQFPVGAPGVFELNSRMADMVALADQAVDLVQYAVAAREWTVLAHLHMS